MAEIMGTFALGLDNFVAYYEKLNWDTSFRGEAYPPRIVMEQSTPPLFIVEDGQKKLVPNPTIQIIGRPETEVITTGKLPIGPGPDPAGKKGPWGICPECGAVGYCYWDKKTDTCTCMACGHKDNGTIR